MLCGFVRGIDDRHYGEASRAIAVIQDGAEVPKFEAVMRVEGEAATPQAVGAENAPAGTDAAFNGIPLLANGGLSDGSDYR